MNIINELYSDGTNYAKDVNYANTSTSDTLNGTNVQTIIDDIIGALDGADKSIIDVQEYLAKKNLANGILVLDGTGYIPTELIPNMALNNSYTSTTCTTIEEFISLDACKSVRDNMTKGDTIAFTNAKGYKEVWWLTGRNNLLKDDYIKIESDNVSWTMITDKPKTAEELGIGDLVTTEAFNDMEERMGELKNSVSEGKEYIANALTQKNQTAITGTSTFKELGDAITAISIDATATEADILEGKTAWSQGILMTGTAKPVTTTIYNPPKITSGVNDKTVIIEGGSFVTEDQYVRCVNSIDYDFSILDRYTSIQWIDTKDFTVITKSALDSDTDEHISPLHGFSIDTAYSFMLHMSFVHYYDTTSESNYNYYYDIYIPLVYNSTNDSYEGTYVVNHNAVDTSNIFIGTLHFKIENLTGDLPILSVRCDRNTSSNKANGYFAFRDLGFQIVATVSGDSEVNPDNPDTDDPDETEDYLGDIDYGTAINVMNLSWEEDTALSSSFVNGAASVIRNGDSDEIHIIGGDGAGTTHYTYNANGWEEVTNATNTAKLPYNFQNGKLVVLNNVLHLLGGNSDNTDSNYARGHWVYNKTTKEWSQLDNLPFDFGQYGVATVYNNEIYIASGVTANSSTTVNDFYKYNTDGEWVSTGILLKYNMTHGNMLFVNDQLHLLGGISDTKGHWVYNTDKERWDSLGDLPIECIDANVLVDSQNRIHLVKDASHYVYYDEGWTTLYPGTIDYSTANACLVEYSGELHLLGGAHPNTTKHTKMPLYSK